jgi:hypothetical protein
MQIPKNDKDLLYIFECGRCERAFVRGHGSSYSCGVNHLPGTCCHFNDSELPNGALDVMLKVYAEAATKERRVELAATSFGKTP